MALTFRLRGCPVSGAQGLFPQHLLFLPHLPCRCLTWTLPGVLFPASSLPRSCLCAFKLPSSVKLFFQLFWSPSSLISVVIIMIAHFNSFGLQFGSQVRLQAAWSSCLSHSLYLSYVLLYVSSVQQELNKFPLFFLFHWLFFGWLIDSGPNTF